MEMSRNWPPNTWCSRTWFFDRVKWKRSVLQTTKCQVVRLENCLRDDQLFRWNDVDTNVRLWNKKYEKYWKKHWVPGRILTDRVDDVRHFDIRRYSFTPKLICNQILTSTTKKSNSWQLRKFLSKRVTISNILMLFCICWNVDWKQSRQLTKN